MFDEQTVIVPQGGSGGDDVIVGHHDARHVVTPGDRVPADLADLGGAQRISGDAVEFGRYPVIRGQSLMQARCTHRFGADDPIAGPHPGGQAGNQSAAAHTGHYRQRALDIGGQFGSDRPGTGDDVGQVVGVQQQGTRLIRHRRGYLGGHLVAVAGQVHLRAQRRAAGKPAHGQITLALREANGQHILTLSDDGAGLDLNAIGRQAARLGLWQGAEPPTAEQAAQLIVHPQLSTAAALSETAGRGIGMDAVQAQIQALGGQLHIASRTGQGCTTTITLPAPPAVLPIQVLRAGSWQVALPSQWIEGVLRIPLSLAEEGLQRGMLHGDPRGPLPLFWAGALWQQSACSQLPPLDGHVHILIVRSPTQRWGLWVDSLQPTQEVLLQPPTGLATPIAGLLGTASLPSGHVVPVYEPAPLIAAPENRQHSAHPAGK